MKKAILAIFILVLLMAAYPLALLSVRADTATPKPYAKS